MRKCCKKMQATTALEPIYFNEQINLSFTPNCQPTLIHKHTLTTDMQMKKAKNRQKQTQTACACSIAFPSIGSFFSSVALEHWSGAAQCSVRVASSSSLKVVFA